MSRLLAPVLLVAVLGLAALGGLWPARPAQFPLIYLTEVYSEPPGSPRALPARPDWERGLLVVNDPAALPGRDTSLLLVQERRYHWEAWDGRVMVVRDWPVAIDLEGGPPRLAPASLQVRAVEADGTVVVVCDGATLTLAPGQSWRQARVRQGDEVRVISQEENWSDQVGAALAYGRELVVITLYNAGLWTAERCRLEGFGP